MFVSFKHALHGFDPNTSCLRLFILTPVPIVGTLASVVIALPTLPLANTLNVDVVQLSVFAVLSVLNTVLDALNTELERSSKGGTVCYIHVSRIYVDIVVVIIVDCRCVLMLMLESRFMLVNGRKPLL